MAVQSNVGATPHPPRWPLFELELSSIGGLRLLVLYCTLGGFSLDTAVFRLSKHRHFSCLDLLCFVLSQKHTGFELNLTTLRL